VSSVITDQEMYIKWNCSGVFASCSLSQNPEYRGKGPGNRTVVDRWFHMFTHLAREDFVHPLEQQAAVVSYVIVSLSVYHHIHP
jgi:hypothetical protein